MKLKQLPEQNYLNKLFRHDSETGKLYRRINKGPFAYAGNEVGYVNNKGYLTVSIDGSRYKVHRIIYKMYYGVDPNQIDHINRTRADNRIINLRSVDSQGNNRNKKMHLNNTSGFTGVYWHKRHKKWTAKIAVNGKAIHLGCFTEKSEAISAHQEADTKFKFHKNHGRRHRL